jgi:ribosomal protein L22
MADPDQDPKQSNEAEAKPKRRRAATAKDTDAEAKPKRRRAPAKAKAGETAETTEKATEKAAPKPRRRTTTKKDEAPKAKRKAEPKAEPKPKAEGQDAETAREAGAKPPARRRAPTPAAEGKGGGPGPVRPVVMARARYVRSSARKARLVIDHVRGKPIGEARALLRHSPRGVARDLERLLDSAIANAENNHDLIGDDLYVKEIYADEGPTLKRFRARAQGRAYRIRKRTSHLTVALTPKE